MVFITNKEKRELWQQRVQDFLSSGQTAKSWCEENGFPYNQLNYWLRKLRSADSVPALDSPRWVHMDTAQSLNSGVSLRIANVDLEIKSGFDRQVLTDVILALMSIC